MRTGRSYSSMNGSVRVRIPDRPSSSRFQVPSASVARAVVMGIAGDDHVRETVPRAEPRHLLVLVLPFQPRPVTPEGERHVVATEAERVVDRVFVIAVAGSPATTSSSISGSVSRS